MKLAAALHYRDLAIQTEILNTLPQELRDKYRDSLNDAIKRGVVVWEHQYLRSILGDEGAQRVQQQLAAQILSARASF
jgi:hypothetical protein